MRKEVYRDLIVLFTGMVIAFMWSLHEWRTQKQAYEERWAIKHHHAVEVVP